MNVKNLAVQALQLSAAANATASDTSGSGALVPFDSAGDRIGHHAFLPHRDVPSRRMPLPLPAAQAGRKLANVGTGVTSVSLNGCPNGGYTAETTVGGGAKVSGMHLLVDTASCDLVLASTACTNCNVSPVYNATLGRAENLVLEGTWGSATWSGLQSIDDINLGPGAFADTSLAALTQQTGVFNNAGCHVGSVPNTRQGLLGVGPISLSTSGLKTGFFWALAEEQSIVALSMCDEGGFMFLGAEPLANTDQSAFYTPPGDFEVLRGRGDRHRGRQHQASGIGGDPGAGDYLFERPCCELAAGPLQQRRASDYLRANAVGRELLQQSSMRRKTGWVQPECFSGVFADLRSVRRGR